MDVILKTFGPSAAVLSIFITGFWAVQVGLHKQHQRVDDLAWESVEDYLDLLDAGVISVKLLIAKLRRIRVFVSDDETAKPFDAILEKAAGLLG